MKFVTRALIVIVCAVALHAKAQTIDELRKQVQEAEMSLSTRMMLPDCSAAPAAELVAYIDRAAKKIGLTTFSAQALEGTEDVALDNGNESPVRLARLDVTGRGSLEDADQLLRRIALQRVARFLDFETISIAASPGGMVTFNVRVAAGCWSEPPPPPPLDQRAGDLIMQSYRRRLEYLRGTSATIAKLDARFQPDAVLDALAALDKDWKTRAAALTEFRWEHGIATLNGVVLGAQARAELDASLKNAGFDGGHARTTPAGDCTAFTAAARVVPDASRPHGLAFDLFDERAAALCDSKSAQHPVAITGKGSGNLTLHLRNAGVADFFLALNAISPQEAFIIEPDVKGRVSVDLENVTPEEALAAVKKSGAAFIGPGPLHRVCRAACGPPTATSKSYDGEPITMTLRDADVIDILRTFAEITGLTISVPRTLNGRIGIMANDMPWDRIFHGIASAFHQTYRIDGQHVIFGTGAAISLDEAAKTHAAAYRRPWAEIRDVEKVGSDDIHLAALAANGDHWTAYFYAPGSSRTILPLVFGQKLFDATVTAVSTNGVTLRTLDGRTIVLPLPLP